jgi:hypothetical protein
MGTLVRVKCREYYQGKEKSLFLSVQKEMCALYSFIMAYSYTDNTNSGLVDTMGQALH